MQKHEYAGRDARICARSLSEAVVLVVVLCLAGCASLVTDPPTAATRAAAKANPQTSPARVMCQELTNGTIRTVSVANNLSDREIDVLYSTVTIKGLGSVKKSASITYPDGSMVTIGITADTTHPVDMAVDFGKWFFEQLAGTGKQALGTL